MLFYIFLDIGIKMYEGCISFSNGAAAVLVDLLAGMSLGVLVTTIMYITGNNKYMFFNETSSNKEICSMPKKQSFKCAVYKNGELVN
jgi:general stress protein 26